MKTVSPVCSANDFMYGYTISRSANARCRACVMPDGDASCRDSARTECTCLPLGKPAFKAVLPLSYRRSLFVSSMIFIIKSN